MERMSIDPSGCPKMFSSDDKHFEQSGREYNNLQEVYPNSLSHSIKKNHASTLMIPSLWNYPFVHRTVRWRKYQVDFFLLKGLGNG